jgi:hypothetical protein
MEIIWKFNFLESIAVFLIVFGAKLLVRVFLYLYVLLIFKRKQ